MSLKGYTCAWVKVEFLITTINWIGDINMFLWKKKKEKKNEFELFLMIRFSVTVVPYIFSGFDETKSGNVSKSA